ncbi:hypothetical protein LR68_02244 [Anoxybacillus sp. BCO1]|nr:hypothetical protein LR68_02244 [Anoxybacillus sp. BCO1]
MKKKLLSLFAGTAIILAACGGGIARARNQPTVAGIQLQPQKPLTKNHVQAAMDKT